LFLDPDKEMVDVHKCMKVLKALEDRFFMAGRLWYAVPINACPALNHSR
jgi:hypothetical protein